MQEEPQPTPMHHLSFFRLFQKWGGRLCPGFARSQRLQQAEKPSPNPAHPWQEATSISHPPLIHAPYALKSLAESSLPLFLTGKDNPYVFIPGSGTGDLKEKETAGLFSTAMPEPPRAPSLAKGSPGVQHSHLVMEGELAGWKSSRVSPSIYLLSQFSSVLPSAL